MNNFKVNDGEAVREGTLGYDDILTTPVVEAQQQSEFNVEQWAERKQAVRNEAYALIDETVLQVCGDGEKLQAFLDVQSRFDRYSVSNALLILAQMPTATQVKDFDGWKENGVSIKKQQRGIIILEPGKEYERKDGSIGTSYNAKKVFDVSQTTYRQKAQPQTQQDERMLLKALIHKAPMAILSVDNLQGEAGAVYDHEKQTIFVRKGMNSTDLFCSLANELAHAELALAQGDGYTRQDAAFGAYCASYIVCRKHGIPVSGYDFSQSPAAFEGLEAQDLRAELSNVRDAAGEILTRMSRALEQNKPQKQQEQER